MKTAASLGLALLLACGATTIAGSARDDTTPLPGDSVLNLAGRYTDQSGRSFTLGQRRGGPQIIGMFYSRCQLVCPMLIETGLAVDRALSAGERARLRFLLVSLDPDHDTPEVLAQTAREHHIDTQRWTLAGTDPPTVRRLAAVLDVRYRRLENGDFNHTSALLLLDGAGRIVARTDRLSSAPDPQFSDAIRAVLVAH